jgi:hypothetical protein
MRKSSDSVNFTEHGALRILAAVALSSSLAVFGCTTNRTPGNGEPGKSAPAAGPVAPNATSTPGSSSGTVPQAMISSSPASGESASVDALATLKADEAFRGKVLGVASPGDNSVPSLSMQNPTGQLTSPPPALVGTMVASTPAFIVNEPGTVGVIATPTGAAIAGGTTVAPAAAAPLAGAVASTGGATGMSNTTATPITNAPAATGNVSATPILSSVGPVGTNGTTARTAATGIAGGTLGVTNGTTGVTAGTTAVSTTIPTSTPTVRSAPVTATGTLSTGTIANPATGMATGAITADRAKVSTTAAATATTSGSASGGIRIETAPNGTVVVTNSSQSVFRRFLNSLGFRRTTTTTTTTNQNP